MQEPFKSTTYMFKTRNTYPIISIVILTFLSLSCKGQSAQSEDTNALAYQGNFHEEIIKPQVEAWLEVTKVMYPRVSDDTETKKAATQADSIGRQLLISNKISVGEQLSRLYEMENMIAYGMTYFSAVIASHSNPEASHDAMAMISCSKEDFDSVRAYGFDNSKAIVAYEITTFNNFGLSMELGTQYEDGEPQFVTSNMQMQRRNAAIVHFLFTHLSNETQAYRYSCVVNNTSFFMTFCPLCFWLAGADFQEENQQEYMVIGEWFDSKMAIINECTNESELASLPEIGLKTHSSDLKQAAEYKAKLILLLKEGILAMPANEE